MHKCCISYCDGLNIVKAHANANAKGHHFYGKPVIGSSASFGMTKYDAEILNTAYHVGCCDSVKRSLKKIGLNLKARLLDV